MVELKGITTVLLDIEGTICPISFVKDVLYPYALNALPSVLEQQWDSAPFQPYKAAFPAETQTSPDVLLKHVHDLSASDVKDSALKKLQGYLWRNGYESGTICTPLFPDVASKLKSWRQDDDLTLAIFSSGSVEAQKLFFRYIGIGSLIVEGEPGAKQETEDLNPLFSANFDTMNAGPKMEEGSYRKIASEMGKSTEEILFLSDNVKEIKAATGANMQAILVDRPGNAPLSEADLQASTMIKSLDEVNLVK